MGWNEARLLLKQQKVAEALTVARNTNKQFPNDFEGMTILDRALELMAILMKA